MKKTLFSASGLFGALVLTVVFSGVASVRAEENIATPTSEQPVVTSVKTESNAEGLTKIPTPDHIKFFREIKRIGNSLYGRMINAGEKLKTETEKMAANGSATERVEEKLEKILSPEMIKYFRVVKKEGNSLFGIRLPDGKKPVPNNGDKDKKEKMRPVIAASSVGCVTEAIKAKDAAVKAARVAELASFNAAIDARQNCQIAAIALTDGQWTALEVCAKEFKKSAETLRQTQMKAQKDAWSSYGTALKACVPAATGTTANVAETAELMIEDGDMQ
jgi:hypothetical protein